MKNSCCFTGHRPKSLPFGYNEEDVRCIKLKKTLAENIEGLIADCGVTHFISGMAMGIDIYAAETVLKLKEKYPFITLECAIPCESQTVKWSDDWCRRYQSILERSDKNTLIQKPYTSYCMMKRNKYMVDSSDFVIAVWNGKKSGTGNTVRYAAGKGKNIIVINPDDMSRSLIVKKNRL